MTPTLHVALLLRAAGISCVPCKSDKRPTIKWGDYRHHLPTEEELAAWFHNGASIAALGGILHTIDLDDKNKAHLSRAFFSRADEWGLGELLDRCLLERTPTGGHHLIFRCAKPMPNMVLARSKELKVLIETRGDGGYTVISPSQGYELLRGGWEFIPELTPEERDDLYALARSFDEEPPKERPAPTLGSDATPGDDYDQRADLPALLREHGWTPAGSKLWRRPGKAHGVSASFDVIPGRLWVWTTSTAFTAQHVYRPWHVFAVLECNGDFAMAARKLRQAGYGADRERPQRVQEVHAEIVPDGTNSGTNAGTKPASDKDKDQQRIEELRQLLSSRRFDITREPPPLRPVFMAGDIVICTPGNLTAVTAQAKAGKTAFIAAMIASTMVHEDVADIDCLGVVGPNHKQGAVLYFDTEQSPDDFWHLVMRAMRRAQVTVVPDWLHAFCLTDLSVGKARACVWQAVEDMAGLHGSVHSVFLDGCADVVLDVNDAAECNAFVAGLHSLAIRFDCPVICVIHLNPQSGRGGIEKVRGHLGSQLERKAETNLRIEKSGDVSMVWSEKQRRAPIFKDKGPRFIWSDRDQMHVSIQPEKNVSPKLQELLELAGEVFEEAARQRYMDIANAIARARDVSLPTAKRRVGEMLKQGVIERAGMGYYQLKKP